ncbi:hypothetical protein [Pseudomonas sp. H3(2019)]|uniref:hypothetical protein n=1 Tax=Pseudomonas sp. H3(2019) TaxID=2598724 RepID=UPI0011972703|nr:hypothetical protein [Pseudomonas sp. H3(2019)]TVT81259.1 hypothetical protein FPT12_20200 [Pseudomonas sp. H3(2019)]
MTSAVKVAPVITEVTDSKGNPIPNGGVTKDTTVDVKGRSEPGKKVDVVDNNTQHFSVIADATGQWAAHLTKLQVGSHAIHALSEGHVSPTRTFTVEPK